jgi:hypothetical protein
VLEIVEVVGPHARAAGCLFIAESEFAAAMGDPASEIT